MQQSSKGEDRERLTEEAVLLGEQEEESFEVFQCIRSRPQGLQV